MSIFKMETETFTFLKNMLEKYGIPCEFRYDESMDILEEFRKSIRLRINNKDTYEQLIKQYTGQDPANPDGPSKPMHNFALYTRTPIRRSQYFGNNMDLEMYNLKAMSEYEIELREFFFGEIIYDVKMLFDTHEAADMFELIYLNNLSGKQKSISMDYNLGEGIEPIEDVKYNLQFDAITSMNTLSNTPTLRTLDLSFTLSGAFFLPFYRSTYRLESIVLNVHAMNKSIKPTPENANDQNRIFTQTRVMPKNSERL